MDSTILDRRHGTGFYPAVDPLSSSSDTWSDVVVTALYCAHSVKVCSAGSQDIVPFLVLMSCQTEQLTVAVS